MPQTEDIEYIKNYEAYDCINASEDDDDFDPQDEPYEPSPEELQNMGQNPFKAKVFDPETMLFDLAEARKTETKFRESILSLMMSVLISPDKPNALLCGPAGCGKTKIVEELAYRLENSENVVPQLKGYKIYALQLSDIVADSGLMGDLENKVKMLINYMSDQDEKRILFIDEIHMLFQEKAYRIVAQILKPALSRGKIKLIGATTTQEANLIDSDPAFCRRMTKIIVDEADHEQTVEILLSMNEHFASHYNISFALSRSKAERIVDIADEFCYSGSHRPDNAITLLDRSIASAVVKNASDKKMKITLTDRHIKETAFRMTSGHSTPHAFNERAFRRDLSAVCGQEAIIDNLVNVLKLHSLHIRPTKKPFTMLFIGPSGVGKTEVAKIIAKNCAGEKPITLNMSEFYYDAGINRIIGSPAGYLGSDSNVELPFDKLKSNPYQVILLDEFEKCDRSVQRLFMSVFDEGILTTSQGSVIDFSKSIIIATTNAGCTAKSRSIGFNSDSTSETQLISDLSDYFDVELINRFSQKYTFSEISRSVYRKIVEKRLASEIKVIKRLHPELNMDSLFSADELAKAVDKITADTYNIKSGARPAITAVSKFIDSKLLSHFSRMAKTYRPKLTLRHTKKSMTAPFTGAVIFLF